MAFNKNRIIKKDFGILIAKDIILELLLAIIYLYNYKIKKINNFYVL